MTDPRKEMQHSNAFAAIDKIMPYFHKLLIVLSRNGRGLLDQVATLLAMSQNSMGKQGRLVMREHAFTHSKPHLNS